MREWHYHYNEWEAEDPDYRGQIIAHEQERRLRGAYEWEQRNPNKPKDDPKKDRRLSSLMSKWGL